MTYEQLYKLIDAMSAEELQHQVILYSDAGGFAFPTAMTKTVVDYAEGDGKWPDNQHVLVA